MTDIIKLVKRLLGYPEIDECEEAADALEAQEKEIEELKKELNAWHESANWPEKSPGQMRARIAKLEAENEKLREAMKPISLWSFEAKDNTPAIKELEDDILRVRAALDGES